MRQFRYTASGFSKKGMDSLVAFLPKLVGVVFFLAFGWTKIHEGASYFLVATVVIVVLVLASPLGRILIQKNEMVEISSNSLYFTNLFGKRKLKGNLGEVRIKKKIWSKFDTAPASYVLRASKGTFRVFANIDDMETLFPLLGLELPPLLERGWRSSKDSKQLEELEAVNTDLKP